MNTFRTWTLGCKVNQYETEALEEILSSRGYIEAEEEQAADIVLINTCTVTNLSDRKSRQIIRKAKRMNPESIVVVAGCYSQTSPDEVSSIEGVDIVIGTQNRGKLLEYIEQVKIDQVKIVAVKDHEQRDNFENLEIADTDERTRAYVKVQDGCNQYCSYCIIPYARGYIRSRSLEDTLAEVKRLGEKGFKEIVLTGIHIGSYGKDLGGNIGLIDLIEEVSKVDRIKRIRLSSIEPMTISRTFMERAVACGKLMDHFHLSLQSGCDKVLREMNRKYSTKEYRETVELIREFMPYAGITTDIIVGFPGETEEDFQETMDFVNSIGFSRMHVFPYSIREGTPAAKRDDQVDGKTKHIRSKELIQLGDKMALDFQKKNLNKDLDVLFETEEEGRSYGYTSNYLRVYTEGKRDLHNSLSYVKIKEIGGEPILCEYIKEMV